MARILVDMDGVIANWGLQYDRDLDLYGEAAAGIPRTAQQKTFDLMDGRTDAEKAFPYECLSGTHRAPDMRCGSGRLHIWKPRPSAALQELALTISESQGSQS